jgi:hypothetical protein
MVGHLHKLIATETDGADGKGAFGEAGESETAYVAVREPLAALYRVSAERALRQTGQLLRLLEALEARGVAALPIKGPAWAERLYGDVTLRNWVDLDLILRYDDVAAARAALLEQGFLDSSPYAERLLRRRTRTEGEIALHSADNELLLDLHWQMGVGYGAEALTGERLLDQATQSTLLGRPVRALSSADMLLLTCLHGTRHRWDSIEALLSLALQMRDLRDDEWAALYGSAAEVHCVRRVTLSTLHARRLFGLDDWRPGDHAPMNDRLTRSLRASLRPRLLEREGEQSPHDKAAEAWWFAATEDRLLAGLGHAWLRLARPGPEDWEAVQMPRELAWLYWPLRPLRLLAKYAVRVVHRAGEKPVSTP